MPLINFLAAKAKQENKTTKEFIDDIESTECRSLLRHKKLWAK